MHDKHITRGLAAHRDGTEPKIRPATVFSPRLPTTSRSALYFSTAASNAFSGLSRMVPLRVHHADADADSSRAGSIPARIRRARCPVGVRKNMLRSSK